MQHPGHLLAVMQLLMAPTLCHSLMQQPRHLLAVMLLLMAQII
jgi:hypothetical protein